MRPARSPSTCSRCHQDWLPPEARTPRLPPVPWRTSSDTSKSPASSGSRSIWRSARAAAMARSSHTSMSSMDATRTSPTWPACSSVRLASTTPRSKASTDSCSPMPPAPVPMSRHDRATSCGPPGLIPASRPLPSAIWRASSKRARANVAVSRFGVREPTAPRPMTNAPRGLPAGDG